MAELSRPWSLQVVEQEVKKLFMRNERGFTIFELIVVMALSGIMAGIAIMNLNALSNPSENAAASLLGLFKQARARAISSTSAYFIVPTSSTQIVTQSGVNCADPAPVTDTTLSLNLPAGASLGATNWVVCFTSRGLSDSNTQVVVNDIHSQSRTIEVFLGGSVQLSQS